jgi:hypothetical protein
MTTSRRKYTVGFIGIGKMGLPMASTPLVERIVGREARARIAKQMDYPYDELARSMSAGKQIPPSL